MNLKHIKWLVSAAAIAAMIALAVGWLIAAPPAYRTVVAVTGKAVEAVYATAVVEPVTWAAVAPAETGRIAEVFFKEGDDVSAGDILARMETGDLRARLQEEQELARYYEDNLARSKILLEKGYDSQEKYDERKTDLARTEARIIAVEDQIRQLSLVAPMNGKVLWRDVEPGEVKEAGAPVFWVGQPRPLRLKAEIDEQDIPKVRNGQRVLITADAFPGVVTEGVVAWISPKGDPVNKSYRAYMSLPDDTNLMIGMTVETNTVVQEKDGALLLPADVLVQESMLWVAEKSGGSYRAHRRSVQTGISGDEKVEILDGIEKGDHVIMPPFDSLSEGGEIRVR